MLRDFQIFLNKTQVIFTPNEEHKIVFREKRSMIGLRKAGTLKDYLIRAKVTNRDTEESRSARCNGKTCQVFQYIEETGEFEDKY